MNYSELLSRATLTPEPVHTGYWGALLFRPDLGSQQEFIVGALAAMEGDQSPHLCWLPSLRRLSLLYGEALHSSEVLDLFAGAARVIAANFKIGARVLDTGTPHIRFSYSGYFAADNVDQELGKLLQRQAQALWADPLPKDDTLDDDWAYKTMRHALVSAGDLEHIFIPNRTIQVAGMTFTIGLDNQQSYGSIVSARYKEFKTVENHLLQAQVQLTAVHRLCERKHRPALFVVLPEPSNAVQAGIIKRSEELLERVQCAGIQSFHATVPQQLADELANWAK
jgi:hypothetical protein